MTEVCVVLVSSAGYHIKECMPCGVLEGSYSTVRTCTRTGTNG